MKIKKLYTVLIGGALLLPLVACNNNSQVNTQEQSTFQDIDLNFEGSEDKGTARFEPNDKWSISDNNGITSYILKEASNTSKGISSSASIDSSYVDPELDDQSFNEVIQIATRAISITAEPTITKSEINGHECYVTEIDAKLGDNDVKVKQNIFRKGLYMHVSTFVATSENFQTDVKEYEELLKTIIFE